MPTTYAIPNGATVMAATTYTGNGTYPTTITNGGNNPLGTTFQPDLVWVKVRSNTYDHILYDSVRGTGTGASLVSNSTSAEGANSAYANLTAFASNGFTVGSVTAATNVLNQSSQTFVAWQWQAGQGTTSSNTSGSITSTVSVNATAGFSIVTYTGNGTNGATIGHGLGVAPKMVLFKARSSAIGWDVYHASVGNTAALTLNSTGAAYTSSVFFNNTSPTSSVITLGTDANLNGSGTTFVAYCWAAVPGYSAFGSYTGNGSATGDGPFVYLGFRPRWVMVKRTDSTGPWVLWDSAREPTNDGTTSILYPNYSDAEYAQAGGFDLLSNGFKLRASSNIVDYNASGGTYIFAAFAENPFKYANAR